MDLKEITKKVIIPIIVVVMGELGLKDIYTKKHNTETTVTEISEVVKADNVELEGQLEYEPKIKGISDGEFNLANKYYIQMIVVSSKERADELAEIVGELFPEAYYKEEGGKYKIILEEGKGKSIEELNLIKERCQKEINYLLQQKNEGTCEISIFASNIYIESEIQQIKYMTKAMNNETDTNIKKEYQDKIINTKKYLDKYVEQPLFNGYKKDLNNI